MVNCLKVSMSKVISVSVDHELVSRIPELIAQIAPASQSPVGVGAGSIVRLGAPSLSVPRRSCESSILGGRKAV